MPNVGFTDHLSFGCWENGAARRAREPANRCRRERLLLDTSVRPDVGFFRLPRLFMSAPLMAYGRQGAAIVALLV